jgi:hypothetical protein
MRAFSPNILHLDGSKPYMGFFPKTEIDFSNNGCKEGEREEF